MKFKDHLPKVYQVCETISFVAFFLCLLTILFYNNLKFAIIAPAVSLLLGCFFHEANEWRLLCNDVKFTEDTEEIEKKNRHKLNYTKLAEELAYKYDIDSPPDVEKFLVKLKMSYPELTYREAFYIVYLVGRHHKKIYEG